MAEQLASTEVPIDNYVKGLFSSMETSGDTTGDYLQLEKNTYADLKKRGKISAELPWTHVQRYKPIYDKVASVYLTDLMETFKIPTVEEAALWSYRPGWYQKYKGNIENIPDNAKGSFGKTGKEVMYLRAAALQKYIQKQTAQVPATK